MDYVGNIDRNHDHIVAMKNDRTPSERSKSLPFTSHDTSLKNKALAKAPAVAELLRRSEFSEANVMNLVGNWDHSPIKSEQLSRRLPDNTPLSPLVKLFSLGRTIPADELAVVGSKHEVAVLFDTGLVSTVGERGLEVSANVTLTSNLGYFFVSDKAIYGEIHDDHVMSVGGTSMWVALSRPKQWSQSTLDLGSGCGIQAIVTAGNSGTVIATDVNPRAAQFGEFNAAMNEISNVEFRTGEWLDPVKSDYFDLILANLPFAISPGSTAWYADAGRDGDNTIRRVIRQSVDHLNEGGFGVFEFSWPCPTSGDWVSPVQEWAQELGCDVWLHHIGTDDLPNHASKWATEAKEKADITQDHTAYGHELDNWISYLENRGIQRVATGVLIARRQSSTPTWFKANRFTPQMMDPSTDETLRFFESQIFLSSKLDDKELLSHPFALADGVRLEQIISVLNGKMSEPSFILQRGSLAQRDVDEALFNLIGNCDGETPLLPLVDLMVQLGEVDAEQTIHAVSMAVRDLIETGILLPRDSSSPDST